MGALQTEFLTNRHWEKISCGDNNRKMKTIDVTVVCNTTTTRVVDQQVLGGNYVGMAKMVNRDVTEEQPKLLTNKYWEGILLV